MAVVSAADRLKQLKKTAAKPAAPAAKAGMREVQVPAALQPRVMSLIEVAIVAGELKPQLEQHKSSITEELFLIYTQEMWDNKRHPENFKVILRKNGLADASVNFVVKFVDTGIKKKMGGEPPEGKTLEDMVTEALTSPAVGLTADQARKFFTEEIVIKEDMQFAKPINELLEQPEGSLARKAVEKMLAYGAARPGKGKTTVAVEPLTDEEEQSIYGLKAAVLLKDGVEERIWSYVTSLDQLRKLMDFCECQKIVSNFEFGMADDAKTKSERMTEVAKKYLAAA